jgi:hypothetical protein
MTPAKLRVIRSANALDDGRIFIADFRPFQPQGDPRLYVRSHSGRVP